MNGSSAKNRTVIMLCGLIGSGKSTYAATHFRNTTDLDAMHQYATKTDQIRWTRQLLNRNTVVCHITCYPSSEEIDAFKGINVRYLLVSTDIEQCKTNILIRNRPRDLYNIGEVFQANVDYQRQLSNSQLPFEKIQIF